MSRHALPDSLVRYPVGLVYVGPWTRNLFRMNPKGQPTTIVGRHTPRWLDGQHKHRRSDNPFARVERHMVLRSDGTWRMRR
jgi:hypothetical protein